MPDPIVLAFSGGLDTSFSIPWLTETCGRPVVTVTVDTGGIDAAAAADLARRSRVLGAVDHLLVDAREAFFERVLRFLILGNVRRGQVYPLCVGAERAIQARRWRRPPPGSARARWPTAAPRPATTRCVSRWPCGRSIPGWRSWRRCATSPGRAPSRWPIWRRAGFPCRRSAPPTRSTAASGG